VRVAIKVDWEPLGRVVRPREVVVKMVPVSLRLLFEPEGVGVGVGAEFWRPVDEAGVLAEVFSDVRVFLSLVRDSDVGVVSVDDGVGAELDSGVEIGVELEDGASEVEHGAKSVKTGTDTTCCAVTVTGTTTSMVDVAPGLVDRTKDTSVPEIVTALETTEGSWIDKDWLVDCDTENVCSVLAENEVKVGAPVQLSPISFGKSQDPETEPTRVT